MIRSAKHYTNKHKQTKKQKQQQKNQTHRTLGQMVKAKLYGQNHTKKHTYTDS